MPGVGVRMHAERRGKGPPVVLIHGWACSSAVWSSVTERVGGANATVAFDLPGFGASEKLGEPFSLADLALAIDEALEAFGTADAVVVGHSMGGMVAQHLYAKSPQRVAGLVLCGTTSAAGTPYQETNQQLKGLITSQGPAALAAAMGPGLFGDQYRETRTSEVEEFIAEVAMCDEAALTASLDAITQFDLTDQLGNISVPCTVVVGDADPFLEDCRLLAESIDGASLLILEGVGHMEPMESPGAVAGAIEEVVRMVSEKRGRQ
jgi:pimeloyl-ACP methyl ester carboxylesterase